VGKHRACALVSGLPLFALPLERTLRACWRLAGVTLPEHLASNELAEPAYAVLEHPVAEAPLFPCYLSLQTVQGWFVCIGSRVPIMSDLPSHLMVVLNDYHCYNCHGGGYCSVRCQTPPV
jgi:hypothetical protein